MQNAMILMALRFVYQGRRGDPARRHGGHGRRALPLAHRMQ